jgi:hypothetical protein
MIRIINNKYKYQLTNNYQYPITEIPNIDIFTLDCKECG